MSALSQSPVAPDAPSASPAPTPPPSRALDVLGRLEAVLALTAALAALLFYVFLPRELPSDADYQATVADLNARVQPGDAVLLDPHWAEKLRLSFDRAPILNLWRTPTREDLYRYRRVLLVSLPNLPRSDRKAAMARLESFRFKRVDGPVEHGNLSVTVFENTDLQTPGFDFTESVAKADVYIRRNDGSHEVCPLVGDRHPCPRAGWINVGAETKEIAFKPQRCLWAHPAGHEPLVVEYPGVTLGKELRVMGGIVGQIAFRRENYGVTNLDVKIDGQRVADLALPPGTAGEERRTVDTKKFEGAAHTVSFEVWADNPDMRHFCFSAEAY